MDGSVNEKNKSDWNHYINRLDEIRDLSIEEIKSIKMGFRYLMLFLGKDWLKYAINSNHQIIGYMRNLAPSAQRWVSNIGHKLNCIKKVNGLHNLISRLKNENEFESAFAELEFASLLKKSGLNISLYPEVGSMKADILAFKNGEEFYFEITTLHSSEYSLRAHKTFYALTQPFIYDPRIQIACKIDKVLSPPHIEEIRKKIIRGIEEAINNRKCVELREDGVYKYFIAPETLGSEVKKWIEREGLTASCAGPVLATFSDELRRLRRKIEYEARQLPPDKLGIIVIYNPFIFPRSDSYEDIVEEIEENIYRCQSVIFCILIFDYLGGQQPDYIDKGNYIIARNVTREVYLKDILIIVNTFSKFKNPRKHLNLFDFTLVNIN